MAIVAFTARDKCVSPKRTYYPVFVYKFCVLLYTDIAWMYLLEFAICDSSYAGKVCLHPELMSEDVP